MGKITSYPYNPSGSSIKSIEGVMSNFDAFKAVINALDDGNIASGAGINGSKIADNSIAASKLLTGVGRITYYNPVSIPGTESTGATGYGYLTTNDKIPNVVVPANGIILVSYSALWMQTTVNGVSSGGKAAIFMGENQLQSMTYNETAWGIQEAYHDSGSDAKEVWEMLSTDPVGLISRMTNTSHTGAFPTTGMTLANPVQGSAAPARGFTFVSGANPWIVNDDNEIAAVMGGLCTIVRPAAGTYDIGVKYKVQTTGKEVKAKERLLHVAVLG